MSKTKFPVVAGILEIILACISMFIGSMALTLTIRSGMLFVLRIYSLQIALGVFGLIAFILGLMGGIFAIKRSRFFIALTGSFVLICWGFFFGWFVISVNPREYSGIMFGNLMILLSIVDLILVFTSKAEFT